MNFLKKHNMDTFDYKKYLESNPLLSEVIGIGRPTHRDKKNKIAIARSANKTANYHDLLKYYQYAIAKIPRHKREKANNAQAMHDRYSQEVWDILKKSYPEANLSETPPQSWTDTAGELIQNFPQDYKKSIYQPFYSMYQGDIDEIRSPQTDFTPSQLVPRMEGMVDRETYKRFIDSLDDLLDDWYMEGFEKDDVLAFMKVIIPSS